ncbi:hypothetical protein FHS82_003207 [Pseudochelatococcus lubricantis]|uniref:DUF4167 domain-containing protein n=1 Tax=Pseudochelatococcus lubricantis TaxID=1538102 RepID=A0ABX0V336_9HYPH|nr:DUF4167 domain-containing protein [Pseudochelatococcus lubricantis]NIJ59352.1 hypothetical protein [Pseudochelatococcus lubricantis]
MRPGQNRRMRNRNRKAPNPLTKTFESNGPDVKVRGTAQHIAEKYTQLSRDAHVAGDPVAAENYLQHAEHYLRIILAAQAQYQQNFGFPRPFDDDQEDAGEDGGYGYGVQDYGSPQPDTRTSDQRQGGQRQTDSRLAAFDDEGQPVPQRERTERSGRGQDRTQDGAQQERGAHDRSERQDRRERFRRRREENINGYAQQPAEDAGAARQPSLPAFLTTPVRTTAVETDEQPVVARPRTADEAPEAAPRDQTADVAAAAPVAVAAPEPAPPAPVTAAEEPAEAPAPRTRRRRTTAVAVTSVEEGSVGEEEAAAPVRKLRATRTRKKTVESDLPVTE